MGKLSREQAILILSEAERNNPGTWASHSVVAAHCAGAIAKHCPDMEEEKAFVMGLR